MVKLEVGGAYEARNGLRAKVLSCELDGYSDHIPYFVKYSDGAEYYLSKNGRVWKSSESSRDLIAEWQEEPAEVIGENARVIPIDAAPDELFERMAETRSKPYDAPRSKYHRIIKGVEVDIYDILVAWGVTCPARQHAIKKLLMAGERGAKGVAQDLDEAIQATERAKDLAV